MIKKLLHNLVYAIAIFCLTGIAAAELPDSQVEQTANDQKTVDKSEFSAFEETNTSATSISEKSMQNRTKSSANESDNVNWIPMDWYSGY